MNAFLGGHVALLQIYVAPYILLISTEYHATFKHSVLSGEMGGGGLQPT